MFITRSTWIAVVGLLLVASRPTCAQVGLRALVSGCAEGQMELCQQVGNVARDGMDDREDPPGSLEALGTAFRGRADALGLLAIDPPPLFQGYQAVVRDYFAYPLVSPAQREQFFFEQGLAGCAQHYADTWLHERQWWPVTATGVPEWKVLYLHVLDHYFGYCVPQHGGGQTVQMKPRITRISPEPLSP